VPGRGQASVGHQGRDHIPEVPRGRSGGLSGRSARGSCGIGRGSIGRIGSFVDFRASAHLFSSHGVLNFSSETEFYIFLPPLDR